MADSVMREITCELQGLHFNRGDIPVLRGLDLTFEPGKLHGIIGPNGSGKSTLLDVITGQHGPSKGDILLNGTSLTAMAPSELARNVAVLPQQTDFNFPFTVRETVLMGRHPHIPRFTRPSLHDFEIVDEALRQTDMTSLSDRSVSTLSGGERQRTGLARALAQQTPLLLLDEPTSSMDIRHALAAMDLFHRLARQGRTIIAVLHDLNLAARCDTLTALKDGTAHSHGPARETLTSNLIEKVFGVSTTVTEHPQSRYPLLIFNQN